MDGLEKYDALKLRLTIDLLRIDQEIAQMPQLVQEAGELAAASNDEENASRLALDVIRTEAAARLREVESGSKPRSETMIDSMLNGEEDVQAARVAYDAARLQSSRWNNLLSAMREKSRLLGKAADLTVAGYITPSSYAPGRREKK